MFSYNVFILLTVLATHAARVVGQSPRSPRCPETGVLLEKLNNLTTALTSIDTGLSRVEDIIDEQCPCADNSSECFEVRVTNFRAELQALLADVANVTGDAPTDCPERTGAIYVATCDGTDVLAVDPNGIFQNGFSTDENVTRWSVYENNADSYGYEYFINNLFQARCRSDPAKVEIVLGSSSDSPLTADAVGTGIAYNNATDEDLVAITFANQTLNGIYAFNRTSPVSISLYASFDGPTGLLKVADDGTVYMTSGRQVYTIPSTGSPVQVIFWSTEITSFEVLSNGVIVFCESSGGVWRRNPDTTPVSFQQLRFPNSGLVCRSVVFNPCDDSIYVASNDNADLEVYSTSNYQLVNRLTYTSSSVSACPSIAADPSFWLNLDWKPRDPNTVNCKKKKNRVEVLLRQ
ncbi:uncharacterized protein LOC124265550 [Haliotis rubra]|uniref:uncharacterized protein LOC124265550 n=1 Tax=Haliotis rubra TaxID=36100 RepID=UPI001EE5760F|nr:uncharacterized protein LOC124265550 [Haliotis rubra]